MEYQQGKFPERVGVSSNVQVSFDERTSVF
jgi:hypothetical protein